MRISISGFLSDVCGASGVLSAAAVPVLVSFIGAGVDYAQVSRARATLQSAADSAALAMANGQLNDAPLTTADARAYVEANIRNQPGLELDTIRTTQPKSGHATVRLEGRVEMNFMSLLGRDTLDLTAFSEVRYDNPPDLDVMVLLDNSPSMLIGATEADMAAIGVINQTMGEGNCAFACHYEGRDSYTLAHEDGISTRLDAAKDAINTAMMIARDSELNAYADIFFRVDTFTEGYQQVADGEAAMLLSSGVVDGITPIDSWSGGRKYTQSDQGMALSTAATSLSARRNSHPDRQSFFLFITDGVVDAKIDGSRIISPVDETWCDAVKAQGVKVGVIYTTYFEIPTNGFWRNNVQPFTDDIGPKLASCASPGWFFEAQYEEDINDAMTKLMGLALPQPRLTQ